VEITVAMDRTPHIKKLSRLARSCVDAVHDVVVIVVVGIIISILYR
jgi:hypothetical protein